MKLMSGLIATSGAAAGLVLGNYLYEADKKANEYNEVPIPFYTVRKAAEDIGKEAEKLYTNIKNKVTKKSEETVATDTSLESAETEESKLEETTVSDTEVPTEDVAVEKIEETTDDKAVVESSDSEVAEAKVIDATVIDGKAVVVEEAPEEVKSTATNDSKDEPIIPKFTVTDEDPVAEETTKVTEPKRKSSTSKKKEDVAAK